MAGLAIVALMLAVAGSVALVITRRNVGPWPSEQHVLLHGLAAWPADTRAEAEAECSKADGWRRDAAATIERFASQVLRYPDPIFDLPSRANPHRREALVTTKTSKSLFLGSAIEVQRLGRCWYVVNGEPREGESFLDLAYQSGPDSPRAIVHSKGGFPQTEIGWGEWERDIHFSEPRNQIVMEVPAHAASQPGHYMLTYGGDDDVSEMVDIDLLGAIPPVATNRLSRHELPERTEDKGLCKLPDTNRRGPPRLINRVVDTLGNGASSGVAYPPPNTLEKTKLRKTRWRVKADAGDLDVNIARVGNRCWVLDSVSPRNGGRVIKEVRWGPRSLTFDLAWGSADKASISYGSERFPERTEFQMIDGPFTLSYVREKNQFPLAVFVTLYRNGNVLNAERHLFR
jgi:hypothetical protein